MISKKDVEHIAKLARLSLTHNEIEKFQKELGSILDYVNKLKEVDVSDVEPTTHPFMPENIMREDEVNSLPMEKVDKLIKEIPECESRYVKVKRIL